MMRFEHLYRLLSIGTLLNIPASSMVVDEIKLHRGDGFVNLSSND